MSALLLLRTFFILLMRATSIAKLLDMNGLIGGL